MTALSGLLVKLKSDGGSVVSQLASAFDQRMERILTVPTQDSMNLPLTDWKSEATWFRIGIEVTETDNPWDEVYTRLGPDRPLGQLSDEILSIEPDILQLWRHENRSVEPSNPCAFLDQDPSGRKAVGPGVAWNLRLDFSQLADARTNVGPDAEKITIGHLDTGYSDHITRPPKMEFALQHNFVAGGQPDNALDESKPGGFRNRGHGTGTLSILAGNKLEGSSPGWPGFVDHVGGAPHAKIIPVRIADSVVRFSTGTMVQGFDWVVSHGADVLTMSMGGLPSDALADAANVAYDAGVFVVSAAGNNFATGVIPIPYPFIVWPARFERVVAACGVMADGRPYANLAPLTMQGCHGPLSKMASAIGGYTPNVPWAQIDCFKTVDMDGAGTSSATPQVAAAAALWLGKHWTKVQSYSERWMRVEATRYALFQSALKRTPKMNMRQTREKIGQGVLQAYSALAISPRSESELRKTRVAKAAWPWVREEVSRIPNLSPRAQDMVALELVQMASFSAEVNSTISDPDLPPNRIKPAARKKFFAAALEDGHPSKPLLRLLKERLTAKGAGWPSRG